MITKNDGHSEKLENGTWRKLIALSSSEYSLQLDWPVTLKLLN